MNACSVRIQAFNLYLLNLPYSSSASRLTAGPSGFLNLSQSVLAELFNGPRPVQAAVWRARRTFLAAARASSVASAIRRRWGCTAWPSAVSAISGLRKNREPPNSRSNALIAFVIDDWAMPQRLLARVKLRSSHQGRSISALQISIAATPSRLRLTVCWFWINVHPMCRAQSAYAA
jgi:hypothetical protein